MTHELPAPDATQDEVLLAFAQRWLADQDSGHALQLADYLRIWPGHQAAIAREYLAATRVTGAADAGGIGVAGTFGPYRIEREIGRGGQGAVYLAEDTRLHRKVALKVLLRAGPAAPSQLQRFRREAEVASRLDVPGICGVHDAGIEDGVPYIAMPYLEGETLAARLARLRQDGNTAARDRDGLHTMLLLFERTARILHFAHTAGILHRDIKPANIMITPGGDPVIFDFGLAALVDPDDGGALTQSGDLFGTPSYMSPEQVGGRVRLDRRTDVYSLGISLYESLTLRQPFAAATREALFHAILTRAPADPRRGNRSIPADLRVVLDTAIEKDRDGRYQSAADFADDLQAVRERRPIMARRTGPLGRLARWSRREPAKALLLLALLVLLPTIAALVTARIKDLPHVAAAQRAIAEEQRDALLAEATDELTEGDAETAARLFTSALHMVGPAGEAAGGLVLARLRLHDAAEALRLLDEHHELLGDGAAAHELKAEALRAQGQEREAAALEQQVPVPATALDHQLLATRALRNCEAGDAAHFQLAFAHATSAILLSSRPHLLHYDLRLHAAGHLLARDAILETVAALAQRWPRSARARFRCGWALKMLEDSALLDEAIVHLQASIELRPDHAGAFNILGNCLTSQGRSEDAVAAYEASLRLQPDRAATHVNLAIAWLRGGHVDRAMAGCRRALELGAAQGLAHAVLGTCHEAKGEPEPAMAAYREALRLLPGEPAARQNLARLLAAKGFSLDAGGQLDQAIDAYRESLQLDPTAETHNNLGKSLLGRQRAAEAEIELRKAVALLPQNVDIHGNLVMALLDQDKRNEALTAAVLAVAATSAAKAHGCLGRVLLRCQRFEEAIEPCRTAVQLDASLAEPAFDLGVALANSGDFEQAISTWQPIVAEHPDHGWVWHNLGLAFGELERLEPGVAALRRARDLATPEQRQVLGIDAQIAALEIRLAERQRIRKSLAQPVAVLADPEGRDQLLLHAIVALDDGRADLAARWYAEAFANAEDDLLRFGPLHWHAAITAAMRTAEGGRSARSWLRAGLHALHERFANGAITAADVRRALLPLDTSRDLDATRSPAADALPEPERDEWRAIWRDVAALLPPLRRFQGS